MPDFDFKKELKINPLALDDEILDQGRKMLAMGELYAHAIKQRDRAELRLKVVQSMLSTRVRKNPKAYGLEKATDASVKDLVQTLPEYIKAEQRLINFNYEVNILRSGDKAFADRSIELGRLYGIWLRNLGGVEASMPTQHKEEMHRHRADEQRQALGLNQRIKRPQLNNEDIPL